MSRKERLGEEVWDLLATCFAGSKLSDPRVQGVTLTHVRLSGDLQIASVFYRVYEDSEREDAQAGLNSCKGFLRKHLASNLDVRRVPELKFYYDESVEEGSKIETMLAAMRRDK